MTDLEKYYALALIIRTGNYQALKQMLDGGLDINFEKGFALKKSVEHRQYSMVELLLHKGAKIWIGGNATLKIAIKNSDFKMIKLLIENGANIHADNDYPLRWASHNGDDNVVRYLIENGADLHALNGWSLQYAAKNGHLSTVQFLVENGSRINANDNLALRFATASGHTEIVQYFIDKGANVNLILEVALKTGSPSFDVIAHLIKNDPKLVHYKVDSPIRWAARYGSLDKVKFFVLLGANINARNDEAFRWALDRGHKEIVIYLLEHGARIFTDSNGRITKNIRIILPCCDILKNYKGENLDSIVEQILRNMLKYKKENQRGKYAEQLNQLLHAYPWLKKTIEDKIRIF